MKINGRSLTFLGAMLLLTVAGCGGKVGGSTCATPCGVGQVCQAGQCVCSAGLLACDGTCVASNSAHCGSCTVTCTGTDVCNAGTCQSSCPANTMQCLDGSCVSPTGGDTMHCGGCNPCAAGATCNSGVCSSPMGTGGTGGAGGSTGTGGAGGSTVACTPLGAIPRRLWRLSVEQWGAAVKDLLALTTAPVLSNRGGEAAYAFFGDVTLGVDESFQFGLYQSSQNDVLPAIASKIMTLAPCTGTTTAAMRTCAMTYVQTAGAKAFRRPLETAEVTNLMTVYDAGAGTGTTPDYATGISLIVQALITSPSFIYKTELGPTTLTADASGVYPDTTMNPYEIASQLSFLFLGSLPDAALTAAAADGSLATTQGLSTQIDRLLTLPAVKTNLTNIIIDWFNVRQMFDKRSKDTALLTALATADQDQTALTTDLYTSTQQFVNDVLWTSSGTMNDLVMSQKVFLNKRLATLYSRPPATPRSPPGPGRPRRAGQGSSRSPASCGRRPTRPRRRSSSAASSFTTTSSARTFFRRPST